MPRVPIIGFLQQRRRRSVPSSILRVGSILNIKEGEQAVVTYSPAADKMKVFSAFILEGLESGDAVWYTYPNEESGTVRAELREHGVDVKKYEKNGALILRSLTEEFTSNGKLDCSKAVAKGVDWWGEVKKRGYKHARSIQDVGDFSFFDWQWRKWITDYWLDPRWDDPNTSDWVVSKEPVGVVYVPLIKAITAVNVERMAEKEVTELLKAFGTTDLAPKKFFIDLVEYRDSFSRSIGLNHEQLVGRKILLEFDPISDYERTVEDLVKESMANVESVFVFTSRGGPVHTYLSELPAVKFFLTSISTSTLEPSSENVAFLPVKNTSLVFEALNKVLEAYSKANVCFVFDILSESLTSMGLEKTYIFLCNALNMLSSEKMTCLFLLNTSSHESKVVAQIRELFSNQLTYDEYGLKVSKIFPNFQARPIK